MKTICDSVNHIRFPKENHLPDWARRDNKVTKGDRLSVKVKENVFYHPRNQTDILYTLHE